jgi:hypothetical protein
VITAAVTAPVPLLAPQPSPRNAAAAPESPHQSTVQYPFAAPASAAGAAVDASAHTPGSFARDPSADASVADMGDVPEGSRHFRRVMQPYVGLMSQLELIAFVRLQKVRHIRGCCTSRARYRLDRPGSTGSCRMRRAGHLGCQCRWPRATHRHRACATCISRNPV